MATLDVYNRSGEVIHQKELSDDFANAPVNEAVVHQCIVAYRANQRSGTASTKTRGEVKKSGKKLYRQKGTGRARVGDSGSPTRVHGGVAFGPRPRSYRQHTPKKVRRLGLSSVLADRFKSGDCLLVGQFSLDKPRTKDVVEFLSVLNFGGKVLFVLDEHNQNVHLSVRNIPKVHSCGWDMLNVYDVLWHDKIVITELAAEKLQERMLRPVNGVSE